MVDLLNQNCLQSTKVNTIKNILPDTMVDFLNQTLPSINQGQYHQQDHSIQYGWISDNTAFSQPRSVPSTRSSQTPHRKKRFRGFPFPSRDVTYQTLSRWEYVSLIKPELFPFPSLNSHRILLNQLVFLFAGRSFPRYSSSPGGNSSKIFDNSFVYTVPSLKFSRIFPFWAVFPYLHKLCMGKFIFNKLP